MSPAEPQDRLLHDLISGAQPPYLVFVGQEERALRDPGCALGML